MARTGRPKGVKQNRDESKYWLPTGVSLKPNQGLGYNKETKLIFIDDVYGEFTNNFKEIQRANASTHPIAVVKRREQTNLNKYGIVNAGATKESRSKAKQTMIKKYGVEHALQNTTFIQKSQNTLFKNHGVKSPLQSASILYKARTTNPNKATKGEQEIKDYILSLGIHCKKSYLGGGQPLEIDVKVPSHNLAFEYNGLYWHTVEKVGRTYHKLKTDECKKRGIKLIHIFEHHWKYRQDIVKSMIKNQLKLGTKVYARKCKIKEVSNVDSRTFLKNNHLLGYANNTIYGLGLYFDSELIGLMTVSKHHRGLNEYVLNRFCIKKNISLIGGLSRLTSHILNKYEKLTTFIDLSYATSNSWIKCGWKEIKQIPPDYFYVNTNTKQIFSKQQMKKSKYNNFHNGLTEREYTKSLKLSPIYDCGKIKLQIVK